MRSFIYVVFIYLGMHYHLIKSSLNVNSKYFDVTLKTEYGI